MSIEKQIMINGVDVNQCENFRPKDRFTCYPYICNCHQKPNCYFKQLAHKTHEYQNLADLLRATDIYLEVCSECRDDILLYPSISGKTSYTDNEVDRITLRKIINELKDKTHKCEEMKKELKELKRQYKLSCLDCEYKNMKADVNRYRKALEEIKNIIVSENVKIRPNLYDFEQDNKILDIINKVKE